MGRDHYPENSSLEQCDFLGTGQTAQLNGKVERSHSTDKKEFYQLLTHTDDVNFNEKLQEWEQFYNFNLPHGSFKEKTPYEVLKLNLIFNFSVYETLKNDIYLTTISNHSFGKIL
jgi:hypothetical protein